MERYVISLHIGFIANICS